MDQIQTNPDCEIKPNGRTELGHCGQWVIWTRDKMFRHLYRRSQQIRLSVSAGEKEREREKECEAGGQSCVTRSHRPGPGSAGWEQRVTQFLMTAALSLWAQLRGARHGDCGSGCADMPALTLDGLVSVVHS